MAENNENAPKLEVSSSTPDVPGMQEAIATLQPVEKTEQQILELQLQGFLEGLKNPFGLKYAVLTVIDNLKVLPQAPEALVTALPFVEKMRLERVYDDMSVVPEGKALADLVRNDPSAEINIKHSITSRIAQHGARNIKKDENGFELVPGALTVSAFRTHGELAAVMLHELQHRQQIVKDVLLPLGSKMPSPVELIWYDRVVEADAHATSIDIAYKMKQAGRPAAWEALLNGFLAPHAARAYEAMATSDPQSVTNGHAKRAAFDQWFEDPPGQKHGHLTAYNQQGLSQFYAVFPLLKGDTPLTSLDAADYKKIGALSPVNYLDLPDAKPIDSVDYRKPNWKPWQAEHISRFQQAYETVKEEKAIAQSKFAAPTKVQDVKPVVTSAVTQAKRPASLKM